MAGKTIAPVKISRRKMNIFRRRSPMSMRRVREMIKSVDPDFLETIEMQKKNYRK